MPGLLGQDAFNLVVGVPLPLGLLWLARRGSLVGLLLWPGALFYVLYWHPPNFGKPLIQEPSVSSAPKGKVLIMATRRRRP